MWPGTRQTAAMGVARHRSDQPVLLKLYLLFYGLGEFEKHPNFFNSTPLRTFVYLFRVYVFMCVCQPRVPFLNDPPLTYLSVCFFYMRSFAKSRAQICLSGCLYHLSWGLQACATHASWRVPFLAWMLGLKLRSSWLHSKCLMADPPLPFFSL